MKNKGLIAIIVILVIALGVVGIYLMNDKETKYKNVTIISDDFSNGTPNKIIYNDKEYKISKEDEIYSIKNYEGKLYYYKNIEKIANYFQEQIEIDNEYFYEFGKIILDEEDLTYSMNLIKKITYTEYKNGNKEKIEYCIDNEDGKYGLKTKETSITNTQNEEFFKEYLKVFEYLGHSFNCDNDEDLRDFIVFKYLVDREDGLVEFKYISENADYNEYIEIPTKDIEKLINKYFGRIDYKVENYEGEKFYKIEVNGDKTKIYTKSIGFDRYDMKIEEINSEDNGYNTDIIAKFTMSDYDPTHEYTLVFILTYADGEYKIEDCQLLN